MRGVRFITAGLAAITAWAASVLPATANHQPGETEVKVFEATVDVPTATFTAAGSSGGGGTWAMTSQPFWKVVYPELPVAIEGNMPFRPNPDYTRSAASAGTINWSGTTEYNFESPGPDPFTCSADLQGPLLVQHNTAHADLVQGQGSDIKFELTTWNQMAPNGFYTCSPVASTGFAAWAVDLGNHTKVFASIPREELFEENSITRTVTNGSSNQQPNCTFGCNSPAMSWSGTLELEKNCRNFAGTATTFSGGGGTVTNSFCQSDCNVVDCPQADLELIPLAAPAKEEGGEVEFAVSCYGEETCTGKQLLTASGNARRAGSKLGAGNFTVEPASHTETQIKLSRAGKRDLKRDGKIKATLKSTLEGDEVADATDSLKVTIKKG
jgi:hypothetical protein